MIKQRFSKFDGIWLSGKIRGTVFDQRNYVHVRPEMTRMRMGFVDGGQADMGSENYFFRIFGHITKQNETIKTLRKEFTAGVELRADDGVHYKITGTNISIDSMDPKIRQGMERGSTVSVVSVFRRIAELNLAKKCLAHMKTGDMLILDGTLETFFAEEQEAMEQLRKEAVKKDILLCGLAKSCNLLTTQAESLVEVLHEFGPKEPWYYDAGLNMHLAKIVFVKLHAASKFVFRFEVCSEQSHVSINKVLDNLAANSKDLTFPGYPYGLIKADQYARVSNKEKGFMILRQGTNELDAHSILDSVG